MSTTIRGRVVKIGNSQGIRIPKALLEQSCIGSDVEIEVHNYTLVIRSAQQSRRGWQGNRTRFATNARDYIVTMFKALRTSSR